MRALALFLLLASAAAAAPTVGIEGRMELLLPGPELKAKPPERAAPLVVRIAGTRPHGTLIAYDLRYIGLVPGTYDLGPYLLPQDGSTAANLPPIPVEITGLLPAAHRGALAVRDGSRPWLFGKYQWLIIGAAALWAVLAIPLFRSRRRPSAPGALAPEVTPTLADRLRPLVEQASARPLTTDEQAKLERLLLGHWCERLELTALEPSAAMAGLRAHPEAGALLRALEDWLHRRPGTAQVDVNALLAPYRNDRLPAPSAP